VYDAVAKVNDLLAVLEQETKLDQLLDQLDIKRLQPMHKTFVAEYVTVMRPVRTALDVLQGDKVVGLGYLVPTLTVVKNRLKECSQTLRVCKPLAVALQTAVNTRFSEMMELNAQLAAVVNPMFKLDWVDDATAKVTLTQLLKNHTKHRHLQHQFRLPLH